MTTAFHLRPAHALTVALLGASFAAAAQQAPAPAPAPVQVSQVADNSLRVRLYNPQQQRSALSVESTQTGQVLFSKSFRLPAYGHRFSFDRLPSGQYLVRMRVGRERFRYAVQVSTTGAQPSTIAVTPALTGGTLAAAR